MKYRRMYMIQKLALVFFTVVHNIEYFKNRLNLENCLVHENVIPAE